MRKPVRRHIIGRPKSEKSFTPLENKLNNVLARREFKLRNADGRIFDTIPKGILGDIEGLLKLGVNEEVIEKILLKAINTQEIDRELKRLYESRLR